MEKRGISPLIATVILIGLVVLISMIIFTWTSGILNKQTDYISFDIAYYDFDIGESSLETEPCATICEPSNSHSNLISCDEEPNSCYCVLIQNNEDFEVNYLIKTIGDWGTSFCNPEYVSLVSLESSVFGVYYNNNTVGPPPAGGGSITSDIEAVMIGGGY